jgi:hypothetical protein
MIGVAPETTSGELNAPRRRPLGEMSHTLESLRRRTEYVPAGDRLRAPARVAPVKDERVRVACMSTRTTRPEPIEVTPVPV